MNRKMIVYVLGRIFLAEAAMLVLPLLPAIVYHESILPFLITAAVCAAVGFALARITPDNRTIYAKEGFVIVALAWIGVSLFGSLPFLLSGAIPHFADAFFETVSGFTTTGSTILTDVEVQRRSILFWRSFTHWTGGMGILVFVLAVLPMHDGHSMHLLRAEMPGPTAGKLVSRITDTARILYVIYMALTALLILLLCLFGMPFFDACIHAFGTAGTGGFSSMNSSIGAFQKPAVEILLGCFMLLFGVNFQLYYLLLHRRPKEALRSEEFLTFVIIVAAAVIAVTLNILPMYGSVKESARLAFFQVSSVVTTTGFSTVDFNVWPVFSKALLLLLMFVGGCAGSTAGGLKVIRIRLLCKAARADLKKMLHPKSVSVVRIDGRVMPEQGIREIHTYFTVYMLIFAFSALLLELDGKDPVTTVSAVAACLNNIGPGFGEVGALGNFGSFSAFGKLLLCFDMLAGRLEIYPLLLLFSPSLFRRNKTVRSSENARSL